MSKEDCLICCESVLQRSLIICTGCDFKACKKCCTLQFMQTKMAECMNCKLRFTKQFLLTNMGTTFVNTTWKQAQQDVLLSDQKSLLPETQRIAAWEKEYRRQKARTRFGEAIVIPPRPETLNSMTREQSKKALSAEFFPCPVADCRGFVEPNAQTCGVCRANICRKCREVVSSPSNHVCSMETLATLSTLRQETRACPKCAALIFRISGCSHMHCTHCKTHFDWNSGRLLAVSTNGHYNQLQTFARNLTTRNLTTTSTAPLENDTCEVEWFANAVHIDRLNSYITPLLRIALYDVTEVVRVTASKYYVPENLYLKHNNTLINLRVEYLLGDLTEQRWKTRIYTETMQHERDMHISNILMMYLQATDFFQRKLLREGESSNQEKIAKELDAWIESINTSFVSLSEEYGGVPLRIRRIYEDVEIVAFSR